MQTERKRVAPRHTPVWLRFVYYLFPVALALPLLKSARRGVYFVDGYPTALGWLALGVSGVAIALLAVAVVAAVAG